MSFRTVFAAFLALAAGANAQLPGQAPGPGRTGPEGGRPPRDARLLGGLALQPGRVVKNAPYSAVMTTESTQVLADGNHIRQTSTGRIFRDAEGRVRTEQSLVALGALAPNQSQMIFINDPVAGVNYALNAQDKTATKSTWGRGGGAPAQASMPGRDGSRGPDERQNSRQSPDGRFGRGPDALSRPNVKTDELGRQTIEGIPADGRRTTETIPPGTAGNEQPITIVSETWYSPDLQIAVLSKHFDPRMGEIVFRLTNISRGAPPPSLFQPPADYQVSEAGRGGREQGQRK
jgi:hypothetical protein